MAQSKPKRGAKPGNQNARGNTGGRPRADTKTFNLTLPNPLYQQLEAMRLEGYGSKSEILKMFMAARFDAWALEVRGFQPTRAEDRAQTAWSTGLGRA